jgi:hypothetical protein
LLLLAVLPVGGWVALARQVLAVLLVPVPERAARLVLGQALVLAQPELVPEPEPLRHSPRSLLPVRQAAQAGSERDLVRLAQAWRPLTPSQLAFLPTEAKLEWLASAVEMRARLRPMA